MWRFYLSIWVALLAATVSSRAETRQTALAALRLVPKEAAENLVSIHSFEGNPLPPRWHILVHDPKAKNGVHEYVIADGEIVASRSVSQFAEELKAADVIGAEAVKVDTDKAAKLAASFAKTNKTTAALLNYELKKDGEGAVPLWHVTCMDDRGDSIGTLVISATKGGVISHDGFAVVPGSEEKPKVAREERKPEERKPEERKPEVRRAEALRPLPPPPPQERPGLFRRVFGGSGGDNPPPR